MESAAAPSPSPRIRSLSKKKSKSSASFRLRCPSLNSLRLRRVFDLFDKNGDGEISVQELSQALDLLGLEANLADVKSTVESFIRPGNLGLRFEDFVSLHESLDDTYFGDLEEPAMATAAEGEEKLSQEESDLSEAFKVFDEDGDGYISAKELQVVLGKLGLAEGNEIGRVEKMITSVDRNHDGRVDFFEFKDMMRSVVVRSA